MPKLIVSSSLLLCGDVRAAGALHGYATSLFSKGRS